MRVLVCGDRNWKDVKLIAQFLDCCFYASGKRGIIVIEGEAPGADTCAYRAAKNLGMNIEMYPADWQNKGKAAGPIRNQQMLDEGTPDLVLAFHDDLENSKGTKDMIERAEKAGVTVLRISH